MADARTVEEMVLELPRQERAIVERLRALVHECLPEAKEKGYYGLGVPFYAHHRMICFIWPESARWAPKGGKSTVGAVPGHSISLGFCQGNLMANEDGLLKAEGRKKVYVVQYRSLNEINDQQVRAWLFEAALIDESFRKKPRAKK